MNSKSIHTRFSTLPVLMAAVLSTGCATTFIKQTPDVPGATPAPTLLSAYVVGQIDANKDDDLLGAVVDAAQNSKLEEFGNQAYGKVAAQLAERGFVVELDAARARSLDAIQIDSNAALSALAGAWKHPETSGWDAARVSRDLTAGLDRKAAVEKLYEEGKQKYFAFVKIGFIDQSSWFGIWAEPELRVHSAVVSSDGKLVMESQGVGKGNGSLFFANRSAENMLVALDNALEAMKQVKVEELK